MRHYKMGVGSIDSLMHHVDEEFAPALTQEPYQRFVREVTFLEQLGEFPGVLPVLTSP